jgi:HAD superfamily hydrolase (TIGR01509 family)
VNRAVIFDLDGVLLDSEPLWWRAGVAALRTVGVHLNDNHFAETMGLRTDTAINHWFMRYPWAGKSCREVEHEVQVRVLELIQGEAQPLPGVHTLIRFLSEQFIPIGLCSSSPYSVINAVLDKLNLREYFRVVYSAEDEPLGKPHPGAYLSCASRMQVAAQRCIAFEDSLAGAVAAKSAQMKVIAVPRPNGIQPTVFDFCDVRLNTLTEFTPELLGQLLPP